MAFDLALRIDEEEVEFGGALVFDDDDGSIPPGIDGGVIAGLEDEGAGHGGGAAADGGE